MGNRTVWVCLMRALLQTYHPLHALLKWEEREEERGKGGTEKKGKERE